MNSTFELPIKLCVIGSPLTVLRNTFGMTAYKNGPLIKWGSVAATSEITNIQNHTRIVKIRNSSSSGK